MIEILEISGMFLLFLGAIIYIYHRKVSYRVGCPYCRHRHSFDYQLKEEIKGQEVDARVIECESCERKFKVKNTSLAIGTDPSYVAQKID
ncbi:MAG: hypothetical protein V4819_26130 [Verrucomicrobiota bacterium]